MQSNLNVTGSYSSCLLCCFFHNLSSRSPSLCSYGDEHKTENAPCSIWCRNRSWSYDKAIILLLWISTRRFSLLFPFSYLSLFYHPHLLFPRLFQFHWLSFIKICFVYIQPSLICSVQLLPYLAVRRNHWHILLFVEILADGVISHFDLLKDNFQPNVF